jgi:hypothetical protein
VKAAGDLLDAVLDRWLLRWSAGQEQQADCEETRFGEKHAFPLYASELA